VAELEPLTQGHNLVVTVVASEIVRDVPQVDGTRNRIAEVKVGDETACIVVRAQEAHIDAMAVGATLVLRNAKVTMFRGRFMRLDINRWGKVSQHPDGVASTPPAPGAPNLAEDLSAVEYELVKEGDDEAAADAAPAEEAEQ